MKSLKQKIQREYFSISELAEYSGISQRTLWDLVNEPINPIPHFRIGATGRIVRVKKSEFDRWMEMNRSSQGEDIDSLVEDVLKKN